jgi:hypothetical protein
MLIRQVLGRWPTDGKAWFLSWVIIPGHKEWRGYSSIVYGCSGSTQRRVMQLVGGVIAGKPAWKSSIG